MKPRKLSLVKFIEEGMDIATRAKYPFKKGCQFVFLGEIPNMTGHCVIVDTVSSKIYSGFHTDNFKEV